MEDYFVKMFEVFIIYMYFREIEYFIFYICIKKIIKDMENVRYMYLG